MTPSEAIERLPLKTFAEKAYLDYSMYVILDRALPRIGDGLKPVQRRILYAMSELGLSAASKHKKSARTVGDVLGKFHPHGDSACYEAMVLMAQPFAYRYPLIDGQGNWGSHDDPKSFAAMRYTEARLTPYAEVLLGELAAGTVDWTPNFDGTLEEPTLFPARLPNIILNGATGIAVGMATDIPPHNLPEVVQACVLLLHNPQATLEQICELLPGPDFPTAAELITPRSDLLDLYRTGNGSVRLRARWIPEKNGIVINALPYQVAGNKVIEQIAAQIQTKRLPGLEDVRDESDHLNPVRIVLIMRPNKVEREQIMLHLFATTDLERSYRVNMNLIGTNGRPKVMDLRSLLIEWLQFRISTVQRRLQYQLQQVLERLHILDGLLTTYLNIDEVISIIRYKDEPKISLIERFGLSETQTDAILNLRLRYLAKLEEVKIRTEQTTLTGERVRLESLLNSETKLKNLIHKELIADAAKYGNARNSMIAQRRAAVAIDETHVQTAEALTVILSTKGWIRAAKGHDVDPHTLNYKAGDGFLGAVRLYSNDTVVFFDSTGRSYSLLAANLPSARGHGEPLTGHLSPPTGATFLAILAGAADHWYVIASDAGYGFLVQLRDLLTKNKAGKVVLTLSAGAKPLIPLRVADPVHDRLAAVSSSGRLLVFPIAELAQLTKGKGNKIIHISATRATRREELLAVLAVIPHGFSICLVTDQQRLPLKLQELETYYWERGQLGRLLPNGLRCVQAIVLS